jgi:hypothetical protein
MRTSPLQSCLTVRPGLLPPALAPWQRRPPRRDSKTPIAAQPVSRLKIRMVAHRYNLSDSDAHCYIEPMQPVWCLSAGRLRPWCGIILHPRICRPSGRSGVPPNMSDVVNDYTTLLSGSYRNGIEVTQAPVYDSSVRRLHRGDREQFHLVHNAGTAAGVTSPRRVVGRLRPGFRRSRARAGRYQLRTSTPAQQATPGPAASPSTRSVIGTV